MTRTLVAVAIAALLAAPVAAGPKEDKAYAAAVAKAKAAQEAGKHEAALAELEKAFAAKPEPELGLWRATSYLGLGNAEQALKELNVVRSQLPGDLKGAADDLWKRAATAHGPMELNVKSNTEATLAVDGAAVGKAPGAAKVEAGEHTVTVSKDGWSTFTTTVFVAPGLPNMVDAKLSQQKAALTLETDTDGVVAVVEGQKYALAIGKPVTVERGLGVVSVDFYVGDAKVMTSSTSVTGSGGTASYTGFGKLAIAAPAGRTLKVKVADKTHTVSAGADPITLAAGEYDVEITSDGMTPTTGKVTIERGRTLKVEPVVDELPDLSEQQTHGWIAFGTGVGLIVATIIIDQTVDFDDPTTRDALEWSMAGVGGSLTILGGILLKDAWDSTKSPETKSVVYPTSVGVAPVEGGAMVSGGISF
ncbi:MAG: hypothetical protein AMXMBFR64_18360 [Myxococcales bacterium]